MAEPGVVTLARMHERTTGHKMHGIDAHYSACRDCGFEVERQCPLEIVTVRYDDGYDVLDVRHIDGPKVGDPCVCGHDRGSHIYHEGACRPGYQCLKNCEAFVLDSRVIDGRPT